MDKKNMKKGAWAAGGVALLAVASALCVKGLKAVDKRLKAKQEEENFVPETEVPVEETPAAEEASVVEEVPAEEAPAEETPAVEEASEETPSEEEAQAE